MNTLKPNPVRGAILAAIGLIGAGFGEVPLVLAESDPDRLSYSISTNPSDWTVDRYAPAGALSNIGEFQGRFNVLQFGIDPPATPNSFYNWQGYLQRTDQVQAGNSFIGGHLWVNSGWQNGDTANYVRTGMWGSAMPTEAVAGGKYVDSKSVFPIMSFTNQNGVGRLEVWDTTANSSSGWVDLPETASLIKYDGWNSIDMRLLPDQQKIDYYLNGTKVYTWSYPEANDGSVPQQFWAMYLKARNNGVTAFSTHWSDLVSGQLLDAGQNIGDVHGDVIVSPGSADAAPTVVNAGATIDGSLAALGSNTAPAVVEFAGSASIGNNLSATNAVLGFSKAPGATSHIGGNVNLASSTTLGGNIASPIQVDGSVSADAGTTMGGNWKISGDLVNAGTLTPGNSIGVVGVGGNFILAPTSTYDVEVNSAGESDRTDVAGQATLAGGVNVSALDGYRPGHNYLILTAQGGFAGTTFDANKLNWSGPDYQFLAPQLKYDSNNVYLLVDRNGTPFATVARTSNQKAVAAGLESMSFANQAYSTVATSTSTSTAGLADAFDQLSGEIHASARTALIDDSKYVRDAASARVREAFDKPAVSKSADAENIDGWVKIYGAEANTDASDGAASLDRKSTGVLFGGDTLVGDNLRIGVMGGVGKTDFDVNHRNSDGKSDNYTIGVYGGTQQGKLGIRAGAAHTWHEVETDRSVDFNGFKDKLSANYDARTTQVVGEVGYRLGDEKASVEPFAALAHVQQKTDGFKEKGGDAALTGKSENTDTTFSTLGVRGSTKLTVGSTAVTADGSLGWKHAYGDVDTSSTMALANGGPFDVSGAPLSEDAVAIEAGVKAEVAQNATVGLSYSGEVGSDGDEQAVKVDFTYRY